MDSQRFLFGRFRWWHRRSDQALNSAQRPASDLQRNGLKWSAWPGPNPLAEDEVSGLICSAGKWRTRQIATLIEILSWAFNHCAGYITLLLTCGFIFTLVSVQHSVDLDPRNTTVWNRPVFMIRKRQCWEIDSTLPLLRCKTGGGGGIL